MMQSEEITFDSTLALCDIMVSNIICSYDTLEFCDVIVVQIEARAMQNAFLDTYIGKLIEYGLVVRFEGRALQTHLN